MKKFSGEQIFVAVVSIAVVASIIYGFVLIGSPAGQRLVKFDQTREGDLQNIAFAIDAYWERNDQIPESLEDLKSPLFHVRSITDPKTGVEYEYRALTDVSYELCAVFETESSQAARPIPFSAQTWEHGIGKVCFENEVIISNSPSEFKANI
tara:strand:+ start:369 stop:824 length:456 start_codon:yes stop_codon:yes gene_type:complete